jgi:hypothetical protein
MHPNNAISGPRTVARVQMRGLGSCVDGLGPAILTIFPEPRAATNLKFRGSGGFRLGPFSP